MNVIAEWCGSLLPLAAIATLTVLTAQPVHALVVDTETEAASTPWPAYNNSLTGQRFSPLTELNPKNVSSLTEVCRLKLADGGPFHTGPVVVGRSMYLTTVRDTFAIDATKCTLRWKSSYGFEQVQVWPSNRGVAVMNGRVFRGTGDGRLLALDANTGELIWKDIIGDPTQNEFVSSVPVAWNGLVITGTSGSDFGIRGRILAYDALTGREVWRFNTIPTGSEIGADTWGTRQAAATGGGGTWSTFALDVVNGEIFVPVGNPAPTFAPELRPGTNLFNDSVVVLDSRTGKLKWWYQLTQNDGHDLDLAAAPLLYATSTGKQVVAVAGKDGYVRVIDRQTHKLLFKTAVTTIENEGVMPSQKKTKFCPGAWGGTEWNGPSVDLANRSLYVGAIDWCGWVTSTRDPRFVTGQGKLELGSSYAPVMDPAPSGWLSALDSDSGRIKWRHHADALFVAGVTATAGGIVLTGDLAGNFLALDSANGQVLYKKNTGGAIAGGVVTYAVDGKQYVAFTSGNVSRFSFGSVGVPTIVIMALPASSATAGSSDEAPDTAAAAAIQHGRTLYAQDCSVCHGAGGEGGTAPGLKNLGQRRTLEATVDWLKDPKPPMPKLFPSPLSEQDVRDVAAFIRYF
jgi:alcohol dehydrogenase (cytochrome c)